MRALPFGCIGLLMVASSPLLIGDDFPDLELCLHQVDVGSETVSYAMTGVGPVLWDENGDLTSSDSLWHPEAVNVNGIDTLMAKGWNVLSQGSFGPLLQGLIQSDCLPPAGLAWPLLWQLPWTWSQFLLHGHPGAREGGYGMAVFPEPGASAMRRGMCVVPEAYVILLEPASEAVMIWLKSYA